MNLVKAKLPTVLYLMQRYSVKYYGTCMRLYAQTISLQYAKSHLISRLYDGILRAVCLLK